MRTLAYLIMICVASTVSAKMAEDFESYNTGVLSTQGWTFNTGDGEIITGTNGTKVAQAYNNDYMQGSHTGGNAYATGIDVSGPGKAYIACQMKPRKVGNSAVYTVIGINRSSDGCPQAYLGVDSVANPVSGGKTGRFCFESAYWSTKQCSEDVVMFDAQDNGYIFDIALNLNITSSSSITATLYYRNVSLGSDWIESSVLIDVPFNNTFGIQNDARTYMRGYVGTDIDNLRMGMGWLGFDLALKEDFESYNTGVLSTQGWTFNTGDGEIITGVNGTKVVQAYNNDYMYGTHTGETYPTGIDVSSPGKAYITCQMKPRKVGNSAVYTAIGINRSSDGCPLIYMGVDSVASPVSGGKTGRFFFESAYWSTKQISEDVVMFDALDNGYIFDIALNLNIASSSSITATLCYRNVSLGGDWIQSSVLNNVSFNNTFGIQNDARTYIRGYVGTDIDNLRMGMGQYGAAALKEDFESYNTGVLSTQGWTFGTGDGEIISGANGTQVAQAYNNYYMHGTHTGGSYSTGIDVSSPGKAYFACQMKPRKIGDSAVYTVVGANRASDGCPMAYIGVDSVANPVSGGKTGRFCFESAYWSTKQYSEDLVMFDESDNGYIFDIAVNLDIVSSSSITATLCYRNVSLGGEWIQSSVLNNVPFNNTFGIQNDARTYMRGYVGTDIDNFQTGMGSVGPFITGYNPFPEDGTGGVAPNAILEWSKACPGDKVEVYFGTNSANVASATTASAEYMGLYNPDSGFDVFDYNINGLTPGATYYWRVDTPNASRKSIVWSFEVNGSIVATDTQQAEINTFLAPVYTPIVHENHSFDTAPDLFDYNPRFTPGIVTFDKDNRPYIITGEMGTGSDFTKSTVVQTLNDSGRWIGLDPYQSIKAAYPKWRSGEWVAIDRNIVFDDDDDAYMIIKIIIENGTTEGTSKNLLLYSKDKCWTWLTYELPNTTPWVRARLEARKGHNEITGPPVIVSDNYLGAGIEIIVPTKSGGVLTMPAPVVMTNTTAWLTPDHSGFGNVAVTKGNYTHVTWLTMETISGHEDNAPCYVATYNRTTHTVSTPVIVGYTATQDNHDGPVVAMDSSGYLHLIIGAHHGQFQYTKSLVSNSSTDGWTTPIGVGDGNETWPDRGYTYTAFLCDNNNTLHLVSRWAAPSPYVHKLIYMYKTATGSWQPDTVLVDPVRAYYMCWYHELTMDRENRLFLKYATYCNALDRGGDLGEVDAYEAKWPEEGTLYLNPPNNTYNNYNVRAHDPVILIKDNPNAGGSGWRIADTADFFNRMFKDRFETNDFTTAGWSKQNTDATVATGAKYTGTFGAKLAKTTWLERRISTKGITDIHVKYNAKTYGMTGSEYLIVEWSTNGTTWTSLYTGRPTAWTNQDNQCSSGAENNAYFRIRFRTNGGSVANYAYIDDIEVTGTRF